MDNSITQPTTHRPPRTCGFRLSNTDVIVIVAAAIVGVAGFWPPFAFSLFVPFVVGHFFLFCNIFRIRRMPELIWAAMFLLNTGAWMSVGHINVLWICGTQLPVTVLILLNELRVPTYHGIFARRINPRIDEYLAGRI